MAKFYGVFGVSIVFSVLNSWGYGNMIQMEFRGPHRKERKASEMYIQSRGAITTIKFVCFVDTLVHVKQPDTLITLPLPGEILEIWVMSALHPLSKIRFQQTWPAATKDAP